ncbi:Cell division cycle-related protein [Mycena sanguinolenta]|uniref:Cell division cycle-related protein n=1 Tax=Mycena sanguinolenta TaxID=230812 RepID=A0A8H6XXA6_9AGAR|nr:Cell division cycle-related protein [Mycena sanguinolenta]
MNATFLKIKCTLIGDDGVGKTCLVISYSEKKFPAVWVPSVRNRPIFRTHVRDVVQVYGDFAVTKMVGGVPYTLAVFDTIDGSGHHDRLRPLSYPCTDVFLICFSVGMPHSFSNVEEKWFPEAEYHCPGVPRVIVATQIDVRAELPEKVPEKSIQQEGVTITTARTRVESRAICGVFGQKPRRDTGRL